MHQRCETKAERIDLSNELIATRRPQGTHCPMRIVPRGNIVHPKDGQVFKPRLAALAIQALHETRHRPAAYIRYEVGHLGREIAGAKNQQWSGAIAHLSRLAFKKVANGSGDGL